MKTIKQLESTLLQTRYRILLKMAFLFCAIIIATLAFAEFDQTIGDHSYDKANHLIAFLTLSFLLDYAYPAAQIIKIKLAILLFYAVLIEIVQYFLPYRTFSSIDIVADMLGVMIYYILKRKLLALSRLP